MRLVNRAVFLDRDGVLNIPEFRDGRSWAPRKVEDFVLYPDAAEAVQRLKRAGFLIVVVTNQPDVGNGKVPAHMIESMHTILAQNIVIDRIEVCFDTRQQATRRRKPQPGMLEDAAQVLDIALEKSFMVGDRVGDIEAGKAARCFASIFIDRGYTHDGKVEGQAITVANLGGAADWILKQNV